MKEKGQRGYYKRRTIQMCLWTALLFALALGIYMIGYFTTGSNKNVMTIIAVLGVMPASRAAVKMIMLLRFRQADDGICNRLRPYEGQFLVLYDLIFTSREKTMKLDCIALTDKSVLAYSSQKKLDEKETQTFLKNYLANQSHGNVTVKIMKDEKKFLSVLAAQKKQDSISSEETDAQKDTGSENKINILKNNLLAYSL